MLKMRTLVITIMYDDEYIRDPSIWLGGNTHPEKPHHYGVLSIMAPTADPMPVPRAGFNTIADYTDLFRPECVMPTSVIRDIRGNLV